MGEGYRARDTRLEREVALKGAYGQRDPGLIESMRNSHLRSLRAGPRWGEFLKRVGLEG